MKTSASRMPSALPAARPPRARLGASRAGVPALSPTGAGFDASAVPIQTKLAVSRPGDPLEREADSAADAVLRMPAAIPSRVPVGPGPAPGSMIQRDDDTYAPKKPLPWDVKPDEKPADRPQEPGRLPPDWSGSAVPYDPSKPRFAPASTPADDPHDAADKDTLSKASAGLSKAVLKIPQVKAIVKRVLEQAGTDLTKADVVTEAMTVETLASVVAAMAAGNAELPVQIPEIPLDFIKPGLSIELTYEGPLRKPTKGVISLKLEAKSKPTGPTDRDRYHKETDRIAADQEKFRRGTLTPAQRAAEDSSYVPGLIDQQKRRGVLAPAKVGPPPERGGTVPTVSESWDEYFRRKRRPTNPYQLDPPEVRAPGQDEDETIQRRAEPGAEAAGEVAAPSFRDGLGALGSGSPLPESERAYFEPRFGRDFSGVRVHNDTHASGLAASVRARAFTHGDHIVFQGGGHDPSNRPLLAHELAHVVQQGGGSPGLSAAPPSIQKADWSFASVEKSVSEKYSLARAAGFESLSSGLRASKNAVIGELNSLADRLSGTRRDIAKKIIGILDIVIEVGILGLIFEVAADAGQVEGLAGMIYGLLDLARKILVYDYEFLKALFTGDSAEYERQSQAFLDTISALPGALRSFKNKWLAEFKAGSNDKKAEMLGTVFGQIEALILPMLLSGGAAGAARGAGAVGEVADVAGNAAKVAGAVDAVSDAAKVVDAAETLGDAAKVSKAAGAADAASDAGRVADAAEGAVKAVPEPSPVRLVPKPVEPVAPKAPAIPKPAAASNVVPIRPRAPKVPVNPTATASPAARGGSFAYRGGAAAEDLATDAAKATEAARPGLRLVEPLPTEPAPVVQPPVVEPAPAIEPVPTVEPTPTAKPGIGRRAAAAAGAIEDARRRVGHQPGAQRELAKARMEEEDEEEEKGDEAKMRVQVQWGPGGQNPRLPSGPLDADVNFQSKDSKYVFSKELNAPPKRGVYVDDAIHAVSDVISQVIPREARNLAQAQEETARNKLRDARGRFPDGNYFPVGIGVIAVTGNTQLANLLFKANGYPSGRLDIENLRGHNLRYLNANDYFNQSRSGRPPVPK